MMKLIIDIPEERYNQYKNDTVHSFAERAILMGTPLSKEHWIEHTGWNDDEYATEYSCSKCNEWVGEKYNFCPNCGADMGGANDTDSD